MIEAKDPARRLCFGKPRNIPVQVITVVLTIVQAALLNQHLVVAHEYAYKWYAFYAGDLIVVVTIALSFVLREWRLKPLHSNHKESTNFFKGLPLASLGWLFYAILLSVRVGIIFKYDLHDDIDISSTKITICLTAITCVFYTFGHHHRNESLARRAAISLLIKSFTIDLLDTVDMLDVLYDDSEDNKTSEVIGVLEDVVLMVVSFNLIHPSVFLFSLFVDHFGSKRTSLTIKVIKASLDLLLVNIPLLIIRVYMWIVYSNFISVFLVKNIIGILFSFLEIYDCVFEKREHHKERYETGSDKSNTMTERKFPSDGNHAETGNHNEGSNHGYVSDELAAEILSNGTKSIRSNEASF